MDLVLLSRLQFALTVMFHYIFPPLTIGLGLVMVIGEGIYLRTRKPEYRALAEFWSKLFAVTFAVGVATGIVMEFEFGTNWSTYSRFVGDVFGSALAAEGIFAFFLESGFLAVVVFGWHRVSPRWHYFATIMVFLGSMFSAVWIVIANSWQQTPAGYHLVTDATGLTRAEITDFWTMVFNPSSMHRLGHVLLGSFVEGSFFVMSVSAWYVLRRRHGAVATKGFDIGLGVAVVASSLLLLSGHGQAVAVAHNQPAKLAALEAHFKTSSGGTPLYLFGIPDSQEQHVTAGVSIPKLLSLLAYSDPNRPVTGLDAFPKDEWPPVGITFQTYHAMVALGMFFIGITILAVLLRWRRRLYQQRWLMWVFVVAVIAPIAANELGWAAAEVGRQPWVVYGLLKTSEGVSKTVPGGQIWISMALFFTVYMGLLAFWLLVLNSKIQLGPEHIGEEHDETRPGPMLGGMALLEKQPQNADTDEATRGAEKE
jgi:cytochrome d ubiquinol oxidase subunit I